MRRRRFGGRSRRGAGLWKKNNWVFSPFGTVDENGRTTVPVTVPPGTQLWNLVLRGANFGQPALGDPSFPGATVGEEFRGQQERITVLRTLGEFTIWREFLIYNSPDKYINGELRWVLGKFHEEEIWDPTFTFPSLFTMGFHAEQRVMLSGTAEYLGTETCVDPAGDNIIRSRERIRWDSTVGVRLETGECLAVFIENMWPVVIGDTNWDSDASIIGWGRALYRT